MTEYERQQWRIQMIIELGATYWENYDLDTLPPTHPLALAKALSEGPKEFGKACLEFYADWSDVMLFEEYRETLIIEQYDIEGWIDIVAKHRKEGHYENYS